MFFAFHFNSWIEIHSKGSQKVLSYFEGFFYCSKPKIANVKQNSIQILVSTRVLRASIPHNPLFYLLSLWTLKCIFYLCQNFP